MRMSEGKVALITVGVLAALAVAFWAWLDFVIAPPHRFELELDEPALTASLTLNGETTDMEDGPSSFRASRDVSDASGEIRVRYVDGEILRCRIGYITNGEREPHLVDIRSRKCPTIHAQI